MPSILITGTSSGIGEALVRRFAREGWTVIATLRDASKARPGAVSGDVRYESLDLAVAGAASALAGRVLATHGCPDVLVNNAGTVQWGPIEFASTEEVEALFRVNVFSQIELVRGFVPAMRARGSGTIVNVTSLGGRLVFPFFAVYNSTKHALEGFSEGLWHELQPFGVRVKAIEPGFVETAIWGKTMRDEAGDLRQGPPPYTSHMAAMAAFERSISKRTSPDDAAEEIYAAITDGSDRLRYPVAAYAKTLLRARRLIGDQRFMRFFHGRWMGR
jgi:NAD(P)-dependent dehydrogenase (short-subunit alcohol dehydrogenase family)